MEGFTQEKRTEKNRNRKTIQIFSDLRDPDIQQNELILQTTDQSWDNYEQLSQVTRWRLLLHCHLVDLFQLQSGV